MKNKLTYSLAKLTSYIIFSIIFAASAVFIGNLSGNIPNAGVKSSTETVNAQVPQSPKQLSHIVIDAGHGGEDGGCSSENGVLEKDLNLSVAKNTAELCMLFDMPHTMTRDSDKLLYDYYNEFEDYTNKKKSLDLKNRLKIADEVGADLFVSIHMNKYITADCSGLQVFYSPNHSESMTVAETVRSYVKAHLQSTNERTVKKAGSSIYLLKKLQIPSILIECGFLSNPAESAMLADENYRTSLACTVFAPIAEYITKTP